MSVDSPKPDEFLEDKKVERSEYIVVTDPSGELVELPTDSDNAVSLTTLHGIAAGATGLKFKNPKTGASRAVMIDPTGTKLLPPADGWDNKEFTIVVLARVDVSAKRRKVGGSDGESDSDGEGRLGRKRAAESREDRKPVDLIVLGVNYKTTDETFKTYFETFGNVVFAEVKRNPDRSSKGFGFVQMATLEEQEKVVNAGKHELDGRRCEVKVPDQRYADGSVQSPYPPPKSGKAHTNKIFVGRLVEKIDEAQLRTFFEAEGKKFKDDVSITDVFIPKPFRGFAFISFSHSDVAGKIARAGNYVLDGVSVSVSQAVPREFVQHSSPAGGSDRYYDYPGGRYGGGGHSFDYGRSGGRDGYGPSPTSYRKKDFYHQGGYSGGRGSPAPPRGGDFHDRWERPPMGTPRNHRDSWVSAPSNNHGRSYGAPMKMDNVPQNYGPSTSYSRGPGPLMDNAPLQANQIANGLDALNLNPNADRLNAAWSAFFNTLQSSGRSNSPHSHQLPPPRFQQHH